MTEFETIDIKGVLCKFQFFVEKGDKLLNPNEITFKVYSIPLNELRWFSYRFKIINDIFAKGEQMNNNGNIEFSKKGIPERIIEIAAEFLHRSIISSPSFCPGNFLAPPAIKAWKRLVLKNSNAKFVQDKDHFIMEYKLY